MTEEGYFWNRFKNSKVGTNESDVFTCVSDSVTQQSEAQSLMEKQCKRIKNNSELRSETTFIHVIKKQNFAFHYKPFAASD